MVNLNELRVGDSVSFGVIGELVNYGTGDVERNKFLGLVSYLMLSPEAKLAVDNAHNHLSDYVSGVGPNGLDLISEPGDGLTSADYNYVAIQRDNGDISYIGEYFVNGSIKKHTVSSVNVQITKFDLDKDGDSLIKFITVLGYSRDSIVLTSI